MKFNEYNTEELLFPCASFKQQKQQQKKSRKYLKNEALALEL